jgi:hypothetical protein
MQPLGSQSATSHVEVGEKVEVMGSEGVSPAAEHEVASVDMACVVQKLACARVVPASLVDTC